MKEFFKKIGVVDNLTTQIPMSQNDFVDKLSSATDKGGTGIFSNPFDLFSSNKNQFIGQVSFDSFKIKRRGRIRGGNHDWVTASGTFTETNGKVTIETEINGLNSFMILFYLVLTIFLSAGVFIIFTSHKNNGSFAATVALLQISIMFLLPWYAMRESVKALKYDLEREFYYLTKNT